MMRVEAILPGGLDQALGAGPAGVAADPSGPFAQGRLVLSEHYSALRGAIAQLAGALLVYRNARAFAPQAVAALAADAAVRARRSEEALASQAVAAANRSVARACLAAARLVRLAADAIEKSLGVRGGGLEQAERALFAVRRAYALLAAAASERDGCTMIGFDTCCCCARRLAIPART
jgi:hypothetical protein